MTAWPNTQGREGEEKGEKSKARVTSYNVNYVLMSARRYHCRYYCAMSSAIEPQLKQDKLLVSITRGISIEDKLPRPHQSGLVVSCRCLPHKPTACRPDMTALTDPRMSRSCVTKQTTLPHTIETASRDNAFHLLLPSRQTLTVAIAHTVISCPSSWGRP